MFTQDFEIYTYALIIQSLVRNDEIKNLIHKTRPKDAHLN